jgi:hypothetical protein
MPPRKTREPKQTARSKKVGTIPQVVPTAPIVPPHVQDSKLESTGQDSIYQKVRLLDSKQRKLIELLFSGKDASEACREAGYGSSQAMRSLQRIVPDIMDRLGLTDEVLLEKYLKPLLSATETKFFAYKGAVIDEKQVDALEIRRSTLDMAFKLRGAYSKSEDASRDTGDITVNIVSIGGQRAGA